MEEHINQSVGAWKEALQDQGGYLPESETLNEGSCESYLRQLSSALKNHFNLWVSHQNEGVHEDRHGQFKQGDSTPVISLGMPDTCMFC